MALFRMAFFRLFALIFRHFAWRISFFRLFAWRYFVFSLFRLAFFRYFVFSLGVISSWRRAITPGEKTKERNNEMAQTSHHINNYVLKFSSHKNDAENQLPRFVPRMYLPEMDREFDSELKSVNYRSRSADDLLDSRKASVILYQLSKIQNLICQNSTFILYLQHRARMIILIISHKSCTIL